MAIQDEFDAAARCSRGRGVTERSSRLRFSTRRLLVAGSLALVADGLSVFFTLAPPLQWSLDVVTALLLFAVLGWQWILLPGLIMEAIPGLYVFPFWILVVGVTALYGSARPERAAKRRVEVRERARAESAQLSESREEGPRS